MERRSTRHRASEARPQRGWTIWETIVGVNILGFAVIALTSLFSGMENARHEAYARQGAQEHLRENLEAVASLLRRADLTSLDGFDASGRSSRLSFTLVADAEANSVATGREHLLWVPLQKPVRGVEGPGQVVHLRDGVSHVVAEHVPHGAFAVRLDQGLLVVEMGAYKVFADRTQTALGTTAVLPRN